MRRGEHTPVAVVEIHTPICIRHHGWRTTGLGADEERIVLSGTISGEQVDLLIDGVLRAAVRRPRLVSWATTRRGPVSTIERDLGVCMRLTCFLTAVLVVVVGRVGVVGWLDAGVVAPAVLVLEGSVIERFQESR